MKKFAKLFDLPEHQVIVAKDFSNEDEEMEGQLVVTTFIDSVKVQMKYGFEKLADRDQAFEKYDRAAAEKLISSSINLFTKT